MQSCDVKSAGFMAHSVLTRPSPKEIISLTAHDRLNDWIGSDRGFHSRRSHGRLLLASDFCCFGLDLVLVGFQTPKPGPPVDTAPSVKGEAPGFVLRRFLGPPIRTPGEYPRQLFVHERPTLAG